MNRLVTCTVWWTILYGINTTYTIKILSGTDVSKTDTDMLSGLSLPHSSFLGCEGLVDDTCSVVLPVE